MAKVRNAQLRKATVAYLYADGHLVVVYEKSDKDAGTINWVKIFENTGVKTNFKGRLIINKGALPFVLKAKEVMATEADPKKGSKSTQKAGIAVGTITLESGINGCGPFHISVFPDLISSDFTYQPDVDEKFKDIKDAHHWSDHKVKEIITAK